MEIRRKKQDEALHNNINESEQPLKRQAKNNQNEIEPIDRHNHSAYSCKDDEDPQLTTKGQDAYFAAAVTVGVASQAKGEVSTLKGRSKGSSFTLDSSKQQEAHRESVKSVLKKVMPR